MHETGIIRGLIRRIEAAAMEAGATRISGVAVRLGSLSQMSVGHFREHFVVESRGTVAEGAALRILVSEDIEDPHAQTVMIESIDLELPEEAV
jgi:hydrogenase nickel incorporation protein HypA/HybF